MFHKPFSGFSIDDADAAREFYTDVLGLDVRELGNGFLQLALDGDTVVLLYPEGRPPAGHVHRAQPARRRRPRRGERAG